MGNTDNNYIKPWIKLWHKSVNHELYQNNKPFDEWHSWIDLLLMANDKGELKTSIKALKIRWNWKSEKAVRAYLGKLKGKGMVKLKGEPTGTTISLCKYWAYQDSKPSKNGKKGEPLGEHKGKPLGKQEETYTEGDVKSPPSGEVLLKERDREIANFFESVKDEEWDD